MRRIQPLVVSCLALLAAAGCAARAHTFPEWMAVGSREMVATDSEHASRAGLEILRAGGNAIDAACAVSFALAVTRPESTGLGGGGFLIARFADGRYVVADYRETAPAAASPDMYADAIARRPNDPSPSVIGALAVGVPGVVRGQSTLLERYGTMSLAEVAQPAIRLAHDGFPVDAHYVDACRGVARTYEKHPALKRSCAYVYRTHLREGRVPSPGDRLVQPALGRLLKAIADYGPDAFYTGDVASAIAKTSEAQGGILAAADLAGYRVRFREPIRTTYRGYEVVSMPPPSSGGIALVEALNILDTVDLPAMWRSDRAEAWHYMAEALKHAFADRARWLGDSDFGSVPIDRLTSKDHAAALARAIRGEGTLDADRYGVARVPDDSGTSHYCIVDRWGNCVVATETVNTSFGSLTAVDEWGLILNNEMDDFTAVAGSANVYSLRQSELNAVQPGKRPLSSMTPTLVLKEGQPLLLLGGSGGPRIISSVLNVLLQVLAFDAPLEEAMTARRIHHQWSPNEVAFDAAPDAREAQRLQSFGHTVATHSATGIVQAILIKDDRLTGASDSRKGGKPAGR